MPLARRSSAGPPLLDAVEAAFQRLAGQDTYTLDGRSLGHGLPSRPLALPELRARLLHPTASYEACDAVMGLLLARARTGPDWRLALTGMLVPGLRRIANRLAGGFPGDLADLEAELVAGLQAAIVADTGPPERIAARLLWAAFRSALSLVRAEWREQALRGTTDWLDRLPAPEPSEHPDTLLALAISEGILRASEAEAIAATRVDGCSLAHLASRWGVPYETVVKHRQRAERRLRTWLLGCGRDAAHTARAPASKTAGGDRDPMPPTSRPGQRERATGAPDGSGRTGTQPRRRRWSGPFFTVVALAALALVAAADPALAQTPADSANALNNVIEELRVIAVGLLAGLATFFLTLGGIRYLVAGGDPVMLEKAKTAMKSAAVGYALAALTPVLFALLQRVVSAA